MAITIDQLRNFTGTHALKLDSTGDGVTSASALQRFRSFFHIGTAREENRQLVDAIRTAIQNDPRFFAADVQQRATALLDGVRTDRAIGVAQVKSILAELDGMSEDWKRRLVAKDIATGHLAGRPVPAFAQGHEDEYRELAVATIVKNEPPEGYGRMNYAARLDDFDRTLGELFDRLDPTGASEDREILSSTCWRMFDAFDHGLRPRDSLEAIVDRVKASIQESHAVGVQFGEEARAAVVDVLKSLTKPLPPGSVTSLVSIGRSIPKHGLDALGANSSADEIHRALFGFSEELRHANVGALNLDGPDEILPAQSIMVQSAIASLTGQQKMGILSALETDAGKNLLAYYDDVANESGTTYNMFSTIGAICVQLKTSLGLPNPEEPLDHPDTFDHKALPNSALVTMSPTALVSGDGASLLLQPFQDFVARHFDDPACDRDAAKLFRDRMNQSVKNSLITNVAQQIGERYDLEATDTAFAKDLVRGMPVFLPNGERLPRTYPEAREKMLQFVTNDPTAKWETADTVSKTKAMVVMTAVNQSMFGAIKLAPGDALDETGRRELVPFDMLNPLPERDESFVLSMSANGDITVKAHIRQHTGAMQTVDSGGNINLHMTSTESFNDYEGEVTFPAANLDALSRADWRSYSHAAVRAIEAREGRTAHSREFQAGVISQQYRFDGTVNVSMHVHVEKRPARAQ